MKNKKYYNLDELLGMIEEPNQSVCHRVLEGNKELFERAVGSSHNHQCWVGGYLDHITEIMNIVVLLYEPLNKVRPLPFSLSDALLVLYLHDLEKPWRYVINGNGEISVNTKLKNKRTDVKPFVENKIEEYGFVLTPKHWNGIHYAEGEHNDYTPGKRTQIPLAAFVHMCDNWSARGWYNHPLRENDPWNGSQRNYLF
jgi:23S rRNA maturation-related 3'-5' exoribonuclease YhaM